MAQAIARIDFERNLKDLIVPAGEYWLAIDIKKYVQGDGVTLFKDLIKYDYTGILDQVTPPAPIDPAQDYTWDGGDLG